MENSIIIGETGIVNGFNHNSQTIFFENTFKDPVLFLQPPSVNGQEAAIVRIEDLQTDRFTAFLQEPGNLDGIHNDESFAYIVLEKGTWQLEDGTRLQVGTVETDLPGNADPIGNEGWEDVEFAKDVFVGQDNPLVFSQVQTNNESDFVYTRQKNTSKNGFEITMQEEEALIDTGHAEETLGWLAIDAGSGTWSQNNYLAEQTDNVVTDNWYTLDFKNSFSQPPIFLASIASYHGPDPSIMRYRNWNSNQVDIKIQEETSSDPETEHLPEVVNFFAIEGNSPLRGSQFLKDDKTPDVRVDDSKKTIRIGDYFSPVWTARFDGEHRRKITFDKEDNVTNFEVTLDVNKGGFDTAIQKRNSRIRVDDIGSRTKISSNIDVNLDIGRRASWWAGPKLPVKGRRSRGLAGNFENYVIENASRSAQSWDRSLKRGGKYLGQTSHNGSEYKHYVTKHKDWEQYYAVRQDYREKGTVSIKPILDMWRQNGLPNEYLSVVKANIETAGEVKGTIEMSQLNIPSW